MAIAGNVCRWLSGKATAWLTGKTPAGARELRVTATYRDDDEGRTVELILGPRMPGNLHAAIQIHNPSGEFVDGLGPYRDYEGDFVRIVSFERDKASCYIPFGGLLYRHAGVYTLRVTGFVSRGDDDEPQLWGREAFKFPLPSPRRKASKPQANVAPPPVIDFWAVLGVSRGATRDEIKTAYRRKMHEYHPDRFAQHPKEFQELATQKAVALQQAYVSLTT